MNKVLHWVKSNLAIVILAVVMVVAVVIAFIFSGSWNASIQTDAEDRARKLPEITQLQKTPVNLVIPGKPPQELTTTINPALLREYERLTGELRDDAAKVRELAVVHNRKGRGVLIPRLFPDMPAVEKDTLPAEMHDQTVAAYAALLTSINAGSPPPADSIATKLIDREEQYISGTLRKKDRKDLDAQELKDLARDLSSVRLTHYGDAAQSISIYATTDALPLPPATLKAAATPGQMFSWQATLWVVSDILAAIGDANTQVGGPKGPVAGNPVKRLLSLRVLNPIAAGAAEGSSGNAPSGRMAPSFGNMAPGGAAPPPVDPSAAGAAGGAGAPAGDAFDPAKEAPVDYKTSFTGRVTNQLYDVFNVELRVIIEADKLPVLMDSLARQNFITILDLDLRPADPFAAAAQGFIYGKAPVVDATMLLETVWLREWTSVFMPKEIRDRLKVVLPGAKREGDAVPTAPAAPGASSDSELPPGVAPPGG